MTKIFSIFVFCFLLIFSAFAQIPEGYYDAAIGKKKAYLKTALHLKIKNATVLKYGGGKGFTWSGFAKTDVRPTDGKVWDMYANSNFSFRGDSSVIGMNIEHSFAKSWWGGAETQAYKDLHHLNPSEALANQRKSSYMMAVVDSTIIYNNGVIKVGKTTLKTGMVIPAWEPADEYKGDFARIYMYMVTAYEDYAPLWGYDSEHQLDNNTYPVFEPWAVNLYLIWAKQDPVSVKEINRNNEVYKIQGNRNPFIDFPDMADYVWGDLTYKPFTYNGIVDYPYLQFPSQLDTLAFGKVYSQQSKVEHLTIKAENITSDLQIEISGSNQSKFKLSNNTILKSEAETGINLPIQFDADETGSNVALLTISGGGIEPIQVVLSANVSEEFIALPATDISARGFTANWTISKGTNDYLLDLFSLRPTGNYLPETVVEQNFNFTLPSSWTKEGYTEMSSIGAVKLGTGAQMGKVNLINAIQMPGKYRVIVIAKQFSNDNNAALALQINNQTQVTWNTSVNNKTFTADVYVSDIQSIISLRAEAGKRVYVDNFILEYLRPEQSKISIDNYPINVGNVLSYKVVGLKSDSNYYYTVQPVENPNLVSNSIQVKTDIQVGFRYQVENSYFIHKNTEGVFIQNLTPNTQCNVFDINGILIFKKLIDSENTFIPIPKKGIYIFQIINKQEVENLKFVF